MSPVDVRSQRNLSPVHDESHPIYLDHHATTPVDPRVAKVVMHAMTGAFGNANSVDHVFGEAASALIATASEAVAALVGSAPEDVYFTSGSTEAIRLALAHAISQCQRSPLRVALTKVEHKAVIDAVLIASRSGHVKPCWIDVDAQGRLSPDSLLPPAMADRQRIVQVLNNLLSNAARHAPESLPIRVSAVRDGVHVAVADEGRGVPAELLPRLFRKCTGAVESTGGVGGQASASSSARGWWRRTGPHPRRERGRGPGHDLHLHAPGGCGGGRGRRGRRRPEPFPAAARGTRAHAHPGGGRRPADAVPPPRHARGGGLRPGGDRRPR